MISVARDAVGQYFTHSRTSKPGVSRLRPRHCFITKIYGTSRIFCDHFNGPTASSPGAVSIPRNRFPCSSVEAAPRLLKPYHEGSGSPCLQALPLSPVLLCPAHLQLRPPLVSWAPQGHP